MKIFMLVATFATFTVDLSHARSIGKREAATVIGLPIQRLFQPVPGSTVSTGNTKISVLRDPITSRHDPRSRRAVPDDSESDDKEEEGEEDAPEQETNPLGTKFRGYSRTRKQEYETFEENSTDQNESFDYTASLPPFESSSSSEPNYLSFDSTPVASTLTTMAPPIDVASTLKSFSLKSLGNLNSNLIPPPVTPLSGDLTEPKGSTPGTKPNSPSMDVSGNGSGVTNRNKVGAVNSKNIDKDVNTKNKVVAVQKTKPDGTPLIVQIYINQSPEEPDTEQPDTKESDSKESDTKESDTKESDTKESDTKELKTKGSKTKEVKTKESEPEERDTEEPNKKEPDAEEPDTTHTKEPVSTEPDTTKSSMTKSKTTKPDTMKPDTTKPDTTEPDTKKPEGESNKKNTSKEEPSPGKIRHGDHKAFTPTGAEQHETFLTASIEIKDAKFGKITLSPEVVDLITWKEKSEKETRDISNSTPSSEQGPQRRRTRNFRA